MIGLLPDYKTKRMPPLTRADATISLLVAPLNKPSPYKGLRHLNDQLIDANARLFNCAVAALPVGIVIGFIAGLYVGAR